MPSRIDSKIAKELTTNDVVETLKMFRHTQDDEMRILENFRGMFPKKIAEAMIDLRNTRQRARQKFSQGQDLFFTKPLLEQASSESLAQYRAKRFTDAGFKKVIDGCSGAGADSIALAQAGLEVDSFDSSEVATIFTQANANVLNVSNKIKAYHADITTTPLEESLPIMLDPARRRGLKRISDPEQWSPCPEDIKKIILKHQNACLKLSPAIPTEDLLSFFPEPKEIEVISYRGEAKEMIFWYGILGKENKRRATILPDRISVKGEIPLDKISTRELGKYLFDPNPALVRSGLLETVALQENLCNIDPHIGYLTGDQPLEHAFLCCLKIIDYDKLDGRKIRALMRKHNAGSIQVRKRGVTESQASLMKRCLPKPYGDKHYTLVATRVKDSHIGILAEVI